jgi:hypothetical protein
MSMLSMEGITHLPHNQHTMELVREVGKSVTEYVVKALLDVKSPVRNLWGQKHPSMLRVGVAQAECDPRVILMA